jgi:AraC family transcriptional regulator
MQRVPGDQDNRAGPNDTFLRFVELLAASLDDHGARPVDLATRAYLSRCHFDRVVRGAAGEPPAAFRRRILLERAAYRLITTEQGILDIAVEAGYASHEAFTRSFERAYGEAPSRWRGRPSKFQIRAPSDVHFHPPGGLRLPGPRKVGSMDLVVRMVEHHVWLIQRLVEHATSLSDEQLDAPLEQVIDGIDGDSLRWLLSRLIGQMDMWNAAMEDREYDFGIEDHESVESMRTRLAVVGRTFVDQVRDVSREGRFDEMFVDAMREVPVLVTYGGMVAHVLTFSAHHRLLAVSTLARYGVTDLDYGDPKYWIPEPRDDS